jgi:hypothetical protein
MVFTNSFYSCIGQHRDTGNATARPSERVNYWSPGILHLTIFKPPTLFATEGVGMFRLMLGLLQKILCVSPIQWRGLYVISPQLWRHPA